MTINCVLPYTFFFLKLIGLESFLDEPQTGPDLTVGKQKHLQADNPAVGWPNSLHSSHVEGQLNSDNSQGGGEHISGLFAFIHSSEFRLTVH